MILLWYFVHAVKVLDLTEVDPDLRGFTGGFAAGHWGFLVPFKNKEADGEFSGKMVRFDLRTFDHAGVTVTEPWEQEVLFRVTVLFVCCCHMSSTRQKIIGLANTTSKTPEIDVIQAHNLRCSAAHGIAPEPSERACLTIYSFVLSR